MNLFSVHRLTLLALSLNAATAFAFKNHVLDDAPIATSPAFAHFAESLADSKGARARDLLKAESMNFTKAPNPSPLMVAMHAANRQKKTSNPVELSVLSYNLALLKAKILHVVTVVKSPYIKERLPRLPQIVFEKNFDIILLQELWSDSLPPFLEVAKKFGYEGFYEKERPHEDGLAIFVKSHLLVNKKSIRTRWRTYEEQDPIENFPGASVKRGFLHLQLDDDRLGRVHIYNTHLQSFRKHWRKRNYQARELGIDVASQVGAQEIAFVGGDLNASPYFKSNEWTKTDGSVSKSWWKNTIAYATLLHYGNLADAMVMGLPKSSANIDVVLPDMLNFSEAWCQRAPHLSFTATDCNSLNFIQYGGEEPPSRQDHLMIADATNRMKITDRGLIFTEKQDFGDGLWIEPSDHYGIFIKAAIAR